MFCSSIEECRTGFNVKFGVRLLTFSWKIVRRLLYHWRFNDFQPSSLYTFSREVPFEASVTANPVDHRTELSISI